MSIIYLALAARALGVTDFGILIVLNGLVVAVSEIARFDSWQAVLRFGTPALEDGDRVGLQGVLRYTLLLDGLGAALGFAVVTAGLVTAFRVFALPVELTDAARIFSLSVVFLVSTGGANGILRLLDRFDLIAWQTAVAPVVRVVGTVCLFLLDGGLEAFLMLWLGASIIGRSTLHLLAWRQLHKAGLLCGFVETIETPLARDAAAWRFVFGTSANATLSVVDKHAGLLAVGSLIGPSIAGLYRAALHLADLLIKPARAFLIPAIYPELARLTVRDDIAARSQMVWRNLAVVGVASVGILVLLAILGNWLILLIFGPGFEGAYYVMLLLAAAGAMNSSIFPLEPLLVSVGDVRRTVIARIVSVALYLTLLFALIPYSGLIGAGVASLAYALVRACLLLWFARPHLGAPSPVAPTDRG